MEETPKQIERQIDQTRNAMDRTIDALSERMRIGNMASRVVSKIQQKAPEPPAGGRSFYGRHPVVLTMGAVAAGATLGYFLAPGREADSGGSDVALGRPGAAGMAGPYGSTDTKTTRPEAHPEPEPVVSPLPPDPTVMLPDPEDDPVTRP